QPRTRPMRRPRRLRASFDAQAMQLLSGPFDSASLIPTPPRQMWTAHPALRAWDIHGDRAMQLPPRSTQASESEEIQSLRNLAPPARRSVLGRTCCQALAILEVLQDGQFLRLPGRLPQCATNPLST